MADAISKGMARVSEQLTATNDVLKEWSDLRLWLIVRIGAYICTASCVYQEHEGVVERKHLYILQVARALKFQAQLPTQF